MSPRLYKPEVFQGNLKKKNYFEGWYFKHVSNDLNHVYSFIPGVALNKHDPHAFIQVLNGITGISEYISYSLSEFKWSSKRLYLKIGKSVFTDEYADIDIEKGKFRITGRIYYEDSVKYPKSLFSPGIMGWYSFVPFMECKHGIVSANHELRGSILINGQLINFDDGKGYIEKDWGTSFPEAWLWIQANNFQARDSSFFFSVAKIPWIGKYFIGFISFLYYKKKFYLFSTYNNSVIKEITHFEDSFFIIMGNSENMLKVSCTKNISGELKAPASGKMSRRIKESNDSEVSIELYNSQKNIICADQSSRGGMEVTNEIFDYLKK